MANQIRWGVIGSGGIARRRTIPEGIMAADNATLAAVFDLDDGANQEVADEFGATAAKSLEALLAMDLDAVYIATPAFAHREQAMAAADAGKHVLCEKPLGMTPEEAEGMAAYCRQAGVVLGTAFMMRFHAQHEEALRIVQSGGIGKPVYARAQLSCWYPRLDGAWRQEPELGGGGSLMDLGGHCIDLLEMFFGPIVRVACMIDHTVHDYASEDNAAALLHFANGAIATVDNSFCMPDAASKNVLELYGSQGSILAKGTIGQGEIGEMVAYLESPDQTYDARQARAAGEGRPVAPAPVNMYLAEIAEFSGALLDGREPICGAEPGVRSQRILAACYQSARDGRMVSV